MGGISLNKCYPKNNIKGLDALSIAAKEAIDSGKSQLQSRHRFDQPSNIQIHDFRSLPNFMKADALEDHCEFKDMVDEIDPMK